MNAPTRPRPRPAPQTGPAVWTAADLTAKWAGVKEVGRHWLTDHDFPLLPGFSS